MIEVPIYRPRSQRFAIAPHSAIVGRPDDDDDTLVVVYYEGNLYNAANMVTFADRAMFAYWRMRDHYPTVAMMAVPRVQLHRIATLYPEYGKVEVADAKQLLALAHWLEIDLTSGNEQLRREMLVSGVRA